MDLADLMLLSVAALLAAYVVLVAAVRALHPTRLAGAQIRHAVTAPFFASFGEFDRENRLRQLEDEMRRALGMDDVSESQARADIIEAAVSAQRIRILSQRLRATVGQCLNMHWTVTAGSGAIHMAEAARHPWCHRLRQRVVDLCDLLSQHIERYPLVLEAPELVRLQLGIRRVAPQCIACPYFTSSVSDAERICPTAKAFGFGRSTPPKVGVVDGEIVDTCPEDSR
jgi:hypothetical protein